jgi:hypothetical protein
VEAESEPEVAVTLGLPIATAVASPELLIVATVVLDELQVAEAVKSCLLPSLNVPVAVNCWVVPVVIDGFPGVT